MTATRGCRWHTSCSDSSQRRSEARAWWGVSPDIDSPTQDWPRYSPASSLHNRHRLTAAHADAGCEDATGGAGNADRLRILACMARISTSSGGVSRTSTARDLEDINQRLRSLAMSSPSTRDVSQPRRRLLDACMSHRPVRAASSTRGADQYSVGSTMRSRPCHSRSWRSISQSPHARGVAREHSWVGGKATVQGLAGELYRGRRR